MYQIYLFLIYDWRHYQIDGMNLFIFFLHNLHMIMLPTSNHEERNLNFSLKKLYMRF